MLVPPSTFVTISRGTVVDDYGDPADINSLPIATDVPAAIGRSSVTSQNDASGTPRQISTLSCVVPRGTDVQQDDRLTDQVSGVIYNVDKVNQGTNYGFTADTVLTLSAVGG